MHTESTHIGGPEVAAPEHPPEPGSRAGTGVAWWPGETPGGAGTAKTTSELRKFAVVVSVPLAALGAYLLWQGRWVGYVLLGIAVLLLSAGVVAPRVLAPVERAWMKLAGVLSVITTTVILTLTFFLVITPVGFLVRLFGRSGITLGPDPEKTSYWEPVEPDGPATRPDKPF